jgi:hypothetical protein
MPFCGSMLLCAELHAMRFRPMKSVLWGFAAGKKHRGREPKKKNPPKQKMFFPLLTGRQAGETNRLLLVVVAPLPLAVPSRVITRGQTASRRRQAIYGEPDIAATQVKMLLLGPAFSCTFPCRCFQCRFGVPRDLLRPAYMRVFVS